MERVTGRAARPWGAGLVCAGVVLFSCIIASAQERRGGPGGPGGRGFGPPRLKNIQVLKGVPADRIIPIMREYNASLGVRCDFCHVGRDFDKDTKPEKRTARKMILMTR